jgi:hypothetical protein
MSKIINNIDGKHNLRNGSHIGSQIPDEFANQSSQDFNAKQQGFDARFRRLKEAFGAKNESELGRALGIKQESIAPNRKKGHIPPIWFMVAAEHGISVDWLLTGSGPMRREDRAQEVSLAVDTEILRVVLKVVETWLEKEGKEMAPDKKSKLVALLYDHSVTAGVVDEEKMVIYIKLVA